MLNSYPVPVPPLILLIVIIPEPPLQDVLYVNDTAGNVGAAVGDIVVAGHPVKNVCVIFCCAPPGFTLVVAVIINIAPPIIVTLLFTPNDPMVYWVE